MKRIPAVDALRGLVMIIMALDHVREFLHSQATLFSPEDLTRASAGVFLTRWITHFCAPVFMFTAGLGAYFWVSRSGRTKSQLSRFLITRGLWLALLDVTVLRFALNIDITKGFVILNVLWALGWSMVILAGLVHLSPRVLAVLSLATIVLHNLLDKVPAASFGPLAWLWNILHQQGIFQVGSVPVLAGYPLIPWFAVMAAGYCFGHIYTPRNAFRIGLASTLAFVVIRAINIYGDPQVWTAAQPLSFLRCTKYPPSLDFLLMTLGPALIVLAWFDRFQFSRTNPLIVFGRVPFFYFMAHFFAAHMLAVVLALFRFGHAGFILVPLPLIGSGAFPAGYGYSLPAVYGFWLLVVAAMYPLCLWFSRLKERRRDWWLSYL
jgi:uncharacterized membrane protein